MLGNVHLLLIALLFIAQYIQKRDVAEYMLLQRDSLAEGCSETFSQTLCCVFRQDATLCNLHRDCAVIWRGYTEYVLMVMSAG